MAFAYSARQRRSRGANMNQGVGNANRRDRVGTVKPGAGSLAPGTSSPKPGLNAPGAAPIKPVNAAPAKPVGRSAQPDSIYNRQIDLADRRQTERLGELGGQEQSIKYEFGIDDPTNPFSRAEGLKRAFLSRAKSASAGMAAQGHLYSGAHERALGRVRLDEEQARAELRRSYEAAIGDVGAAKAGVRFDTEEQRNQAFEDWLARAPESEGVPGVDGVAAQVPAPTPTTVASAKGPAPLPQAQTNTAKAGPIVAGGPAGVIKPSDQAGRQISQPAKPGGSKGAAEQRLRKALREAKRDGNAKRVKRLSKRIKTMNRGQGYTRQG